LQRYDRFKYVIFDDLWKKQVERFWTPFEFNLSLDRGQYFNLEPHEKRIFTKNLLFQTMMDSVIARGVPAFTQYISNPELESCLSVWSFFENIHSRSYTYIIKNVYAEPSKILDETFEDKEILERAGTVTKAYDDLNNADKFNIKERIYLSLINVNILEAVRFYVSFVCSFSFAENKKMLGNCSIIKAIKIDEAFHMQATTAILNILRDEPSEGFQKTIAPLADKAIELFAEAAEEEKKWAKYLFQDGSIMGLNEEILIRYIEWLTDSRLKNLGFPKLFNTKNPIGWLAPYMGEAQVQTAAQEEDISGYRIGASKNDVASADYGDFAAL
jgi:ribonucleoside-diphosphate reductase beta chain